MKSVISVLLVFCCYNLIGQKLPIKELVSIYKKDSSELQRYYDSINYGYVKLYGNNTLEFHAIKKDEFRLFTDSSKVEKDEFPMLFYIFSNLEELNECRKNIIKEGFIIDTAKTNKLNVSDADKIECYISGEIEIQLSNNDFKKGIKVVNGGGPMSSCYGKNVHMYSIILSSKDY